MRYFLTILAVVVALAAGAYLYLHQQRAADEAAQAVAPAAAPAREPGAPAAAPSDEALDQEARAYIRDLTAVKPEPLSAQNADNFVRSDQPIRLLADAQVERVTPRQLLAEPGVDSATPVTVVKEVDQIEVVTPERLLAEAGQDLDQPVRIVEGETVRETTVKELAEQYPDAPQTPITIVKKVDEVQVTTAGELQAQAGLAQDQPVKVIRGPRRLDEATVAELMIDQDAAHPDTIYYVRTVRDADAQGIWGIIQYGLIENFARGIAIRRGEKVDTYRVDIPQSADEMLNGYHSSFLGRMIHEKSHNTYIYNFDQGRIGHNPDLIHPGQELLIVRFSADELIAIYKHFVNNKTSNRL